MTIALVNARSRKEWANEINSAWFKSVNDVCNIAELCAQAHTYLGLEEYKEMCKEDLSFSDELAQRFKQLGHRPDILAYARRHILPKGYSTLFEFLRLDEASLTHAVDSGWVSENTNVRKTRAITQALTTDSNRPVGEGNAPEMLPSPAEANEVANATGKLIAASDGKIYTGTTLAEQDQYNERRDQFYQMLDAITLLAELKPVDPAFLLDNSEDWWTGKLSTNMIGDAREWLASLRNELEARR